MVCNIYLSYVSICNYSKVDYFLELINFERADILTSSNRWMKRRFNSIHKMKREEPRVLIIKSKDWHLMFVQDKCIITDTSSFIKNVKKLLDIYATLASLNYQF